MKSKEREDPQWTVGVGLTLTIRIVHRGRVVHRVRQRAGVRIDEELRHLDNVAEEDLLAFNTESRIYTAVDSTRSRWRGRKQFLAHGGSSGIHGRWDYCIEGEERDEEGWEIVTAGPHGHRRQHYQRGHAAGSTRR